MNTKNFFDMAESLKLYRRAEIKSKTNDGKNAIDDLYVDPLEDNATLKTVLSDNTVFLLGRKGTGKSTIFLKAESEVSKLDDHVSVYVDVKSLYDVISFDTYTPLASEVDDVSSEVYRLHFAKKEILKQIIGKLIDVLNDKIESLSLMDRFKGKKKKISSAVSVLNDLKDKINDESLEYHVLPALRRLSRKITLNKQSESSETGSVNALVSSKITGTINNMSVKTDAEVNASANASHTEFNKALNGSDIYEEYSDAFVKAFPFQMIIKNIQTALDDLSIKKLFIFLDDFSEVDFLDQRLFVDVILSTLNNSSNEYIKLKIAAYPGRTYYGRLDPSKCTSVKLDFYEVYESIETQDMEYRACRYTKNLLEKRFEYYGLDINSYFDTSPTITLDDYIYGFFKASFNVPRIIGHLLHILYKDKISQGLKINLASIEIASRKYYESVISSYFDMMSRFAAEPFDSKLDRFNQKELIEFIISLSKENKTNIKAGKIGGNFFNGLAKIHTSHFAINEELAGVLSGLESNFLVSRYKKVKAKNKKKVYIYSISHGLCMYERIDWGYPEGSLYRDYFRQNCFDYSSHIHQFLSQKSCYKCNSCKHVMNDDEKTNTVLEVFDYLCPQCKKGIMTKEKIIPDELRNFIDNINEDILLEKVELSILNYLHLNEKPASASEIAGNLDTNRQLIGRRTKKLQDLGLVDKDNQSVINKTMNTLTDKARDLYFA